MSSLGRGVRTTSADRGVAAAGRRGPQRKGKRLHPAHGHLRVPEGLGRRGDADRGRPCTPPVGSGRRSRNTPPAAAGRTGVVLRLGLLDGPGTKFEQPNDVYGATLHVDDAARALVAALGVPSGTYNVCRDGERSVERPLQADRRLAAGITGASSTLPAGRSMSETRTSIRSPSPYLRPPRLATRPVLSLFSSEVARQLPHRQIALENLAEPREDARGDHAGDLALERLLPAAIEEQRLEQPREADVVGAILTSAIARSLPKRAPRARPALRPAARRRGRAHAGARGGRRGRDSGGSAT